MTGKTDRPPLKQHSQMNGTNTDRNRTWFPGDGLVGRARRWAICSAMIAGLWLNPQASTALDLQDGSSKRSFDWALDEIALSSGKSIREVRKVAPLADSTSLRSYLATQSNQGVLALPVVYVQGGPRSEATRRVLSGQVAVKLEGGVDAAGIAARVGVSQFQAASVTGWYLFQSPDPVAAPNLAETLEGMNGVIQAYAVLARTVTPLMVPNDTLFTNQWHLLNTGQNGATPGMDIRVTNVWETYTGQGVVIAVVDSGVEMTHPDLTNNLIPSISYDYFDLDSDPTPDLLNPSEAHGTSVAGVSAGTGNNGLGISGVAFRSQVAALRLINGFFDDNQEAGALGHSNQVVHVSNNSWGPTFALLGPSPIVQDAMLESVTNGRGGLGTVYVFAGGNGLQDGDDSNENGYANSIYTISVAALDDQGGQADYSEPGANHLISAPSGGESTVRLQGTTTTDFTGANGYNPVFVGITGNAELADQDYTQNFNGTSSAAPVVSGVVALMLQANPNLGWRDVQEILVASARRNDASDSDWVVNGAGFHFNHKYGAGLVDAEAAVNLARTWLNLGPQVHTGMALNGLTDSIPDNSITGVRKVFTVTRDDFRIEQVTLTVNISHPRRGDLDIFVTSPSGITSRLAEFGTDIFPDYPNWTLSSTHHWGENAQGTWIVDIRDRRPSATGVLQDVSLNFHGTTSGAGQPSISSAPSSVLEGNSSTNHMVFAVNLSAVTSQTVTVDYQTVTNTAVSGLDYQPASGTLIFQPGEISKNVAVVVNGDIQTEPNETFFLQFSNPSNAVMVVTNFLGTIINDDGLLAVLDSPSVQEGDIGTTQLTFNLTLTQTNANAQSFFFSTLDGTATGGADYLSTNGLVVILPGETNATITVPVIGDFLLESDETVQLSVIGLNEASVQNPLATGTILDDEARVQIGNAQVIETDSGLVPMVFQLTLTEPVTNGTVSVSYSTANLSARAGQDYVATNGIVTFPAGVTNGAVTVYVIGDTLNEVMESFRVLLTNPQGNAFIGLGQATGFILDNDAAPGLSVSDIQVVEGDVATTTATFTISLSAPSGQLVQVDYRTQVGTANVGLDYFPVSGTLVIPPNTLSRTITVPIVGDTVQESEEFFTLSLTSSINAVITTPSAKCTIQDNEPISIISAAPVSVFEGASGTTNLTFDVRLSRPSNLSVGVAYSFEDITATNGVDYVATNGALLFAPGVTHQTITVQVNGDGDNEPNETLFLKLSSPTNGQLDVVTNILGTILNDDGPLLSISDVSSFEGAAGTTNNFQFSIDLVQPDANTVSVDVIVRGGTATSAAGDYLSPVPATTTLQFSQGNTHAVFTVEVLGDDLPEADEKFEVVLTNASFATITKAVGEATILDDDTLADLAVGIAVPATPYYVGHPVTFVTTVTNLGPFSATNLVVSNTLPAGATALLATNSILQDLGNGLLVYQIPTLNSGAVASVSISFAPANSLPGNFTTSVTSDQVDNNLANNTISTSLTALNPTVVLSAGKARLLTESFVPANGSIEPGETVTIGLTVTNSGTIASTNAVGTLLATGGVTVPSGAVSFGAIPASGSVERTYSFTAASAGGNIALSLQMEDGIHSLGTLQWGYSLGGTVIGSNLNSITIPSKGSPTVGYPSVIQVSNQVGVVKRVRVTLNNLNHQFASDLDILLTSPDGRSVLLLSDAGTPFAAQNLQLTFDDQASAPLPQNFVMESGTYKPTNYGETLDVFDAPAPSGPYAPQLGAFAGAVPNGNWSLYIMDDSNGDSGSLESWSIQVDTVDPVNDLSGLGLLVSAQPPVLFQGDRVTYILGITNRGPDVSASTMLTNLLSSGMSLVSVTSSQGSVLSTNRPIVIDLGTIAVGATAQVTIQAWANQVGSLTNIAGLTTSSLDLDPLDNWAATVSRVNRVIRLGLQGAPTTTNGFQFQFIGQGGLTYVIEYSTNLVNWYPFQTNHASSSGSILIQDSGISTTGGRFYRVQEK